MTSNNTVALIYQDEYLLVASKPAGLLAVPGRGSDKQDCFSARLQQQFPDAMVLHRLDMSTSGLMLFARGADMQRRLSLMRYISLGIDWKWYLDAFNSREINFSKLILSIECFPSLGDAP